VDPYCQRHRSSRVEKIEIRAIALYQWAVDLDIERMAEAGDRYACACLGWMYHHGRGVDENYSTAVKWIRKAAEHGHADAQFMLGEMYHHGHGVNQSYSTAMECYRKAVKQDMLGEMYENGWGVDEYYSTAMEWYRKAAEQGHAYSQFHL